MNSMQLCIEVSADLWMYRKQSFTKSVFNLKSNICNILVYFTGVILS